MWPTCQNKVERTQQGMLKQSSKYIKKAIGVLKNVTEELQ